MDRILYIDMDGVLADLDEGLRSHHNLADHVRLSLGEKQQNWLDALRPFTDADGFANLKILNEMAWMVSDFVQQKWMRCEILTSHGSFYYDPRIVGYQKRLWLMKHFKYSLASIPFNLVHSGVAKAAYAHGGHILIDDTLRNCQAFEEAGGTAFHVQEGESAELQAFLKSLTA